jgi:hypothetical protein
MSVPSGTASLSDIQTEFGGSNPISMSEYYDLQSNPSGIPSSGALSIDDFRGKDNVYTLTSDIFTSSITLTADDINGSGAAWVGVSGGGGGGAGVIYASSSGFGATGSGAPGGAGGIHGLFLSDVTDLIGASFVAGSGGGGSNTGHTPGSSGRSSRGSSGGSSTFSYGSVTAGGGGGGLGGYSGSGARDPGTQGSDTGIDITASIASYYSGKVTAGTTGASRGSAGAAGPKVFTGGENTPGNSYGGSGGSGNLTIIYEAVPQVT